MEVRESPAPVSLASGAPVQALASRALACAFDVGAAPARNSVSPSAPALRSGDTLRNQCAASSTERAVRDFGRLLRMQSGGPVHRTTLIRPLLVEWRMAGGGTRCEVEFHASPFKSGATVVSSGNQETIRADLPPYSGWKYRLTALDGTPFKWPGGARCPEIIIQK